MIFDPPNYIRQFIIVLLTAFFLGTVGIVQASPIVYVDGDGGFPIIWFTNDLDSNQTTLQLETEAALGSQTGGSVLDTYNLKKSKSAEQFSQQLARNSLGNLKSQTLASIGQYETDEYSGEAVNLQ